MAINIGAMYAPTAATKMTDWMLGKYNLFYESQIPALAHQFLNGTISAENKEALAATAKRTRFHRRYGYVLFHVYREVVRGIQLWIRRSLYLIDHIDGYLYGIPLYL